jgi:dGTPase
MGPALAACATPDRAPYNARRAAAHAPPPAPDRSSFEVDRDRVVHCESFRALQQKTQVRSPLRLGEGVRFRTRLNHTLEVAQLARSLARLLGADEPLAEAVALAHDLGHPPFGHAGERGLAAALRERGLHGWDANQHSLAVVDELEAGYVALRGLNLTWATREGIARHTTPYDVPLADGELASTPAAGLEAQAVDLADVLAYVTHDLDDALASELTTLDQLRALAPELEEIVAGVEREWTGRSASLWPAQSRDELLRRRLVATLIGRALHDAAAHSAPALAALASADAVRARPERSVRSSPAWEAVAEQLRRHLAAAYWGSAEVRAADAAGERLLRGLTHRLASEPALVPPRFRRHGDARDAAAFLAWHDDRTALELARRLDVTR